VEEGLNSQVTALRAAAFEPTLIPARAGMRVGFFTLNQEPHLPGSIAAVVFAMAGIGAALQIAAAIVVPCNPQNFVRWRRDFFVSARHDDHCLAELNSDHHNAADAENNQQDAKDYGLSDTRSQVLFDESLKKWANC